MTKGDTVPDIPQHTELVFATQVILSGFAPVNAESLQATVSGR